MKNSFENQLDELTPEEKFDLAKKRHLDPRSIRDKTIHKASESESTQDFLERRAKKIVERSGMEGVIKRFSNNDEVRMVDIGGGKGHILKEVIKKFKEANSDIKMNTAEIDLSDYASKRVSESEEGKEMNSVFGKGEELPIKVDKDGKPLIEVVSGYFVFEDLNDKQQGKVLEEIKRVLKDDGRIVIADDLCQETALKRVMAKGKNIAYNVKLSKFNVHNDEEWREIFKEHDLEIESSVVFGEDNDNKKEEFISYVLKKAEEEVEG
ncbi:MAG: methyltransferase domain-containing protein [Candidatus Pacebacteria bacterium]|nr:methyltransferase domain-containing protein [Candidatus Paceibacterota bacterium]